MTPSDFQVEKTAFGLQYVIPGTKRIVKSKPRAFKADGHLMTLKAPHGGNRDAGGRDIALG